MAGFHVIDRGDGPKIEGTRITVYTVFEYLRHGRTRDWIAATLHLSSRQVEAAIDYIQANSASVGSEYERIVARIREGNAADAEARLAENRGKLADRLTRQGATSR